MALLVAYAPPQHARSRRFRPGAILKGCLWGVVLVVLFEVCRILAGPNFHEVVPGAVYRTAQFSGERLASLIRRYGIRTVVNLRGESAPTPWYLEECRATSELEVSQEDLPFSATRLPSVLVIRRLVEVIDRSEYPILFHCNRGIDRTGMAVAVTLLLHTDSSLNQARWQLSARHGHLALGRTANVDRFFDLYEEWLSSQGREHSQAAFRRWILLDYCPGECRCRLEMLTPELLRKVPRGDPIGLRIRVTNTSVKPWRLRPGTNAGIHCHCQLDQDETMIWQGHAGLFEATVVPGDSIDLTVALPALAEAGRYRLRLDMNDPQHAFFHDMGSDPYFFDVEVP